MSKLLCSCGNILSDVAQKDMEELWGDIIPNGEQWSNQEKLASFLAQLCEAYKNDSHIDWLKSNSRIYTEQDLGSIISDIITSMSLDVGVAYGRCKKCGTLMVQQKKNDNIYVPYSPTKRERCEEI